jgi:hypothetical protein
VKHLNSPSSLFVHKYINAFYLPTFEVIQDGKVFDFEVFTLMKIEIVVFWVVTPRNDVVRYQCIGGPCCLHLQGETLLSRRLLGCDAV